MGPGHIIFDTLIKWAIRESRQAFAMGTYLVDPNIAKPQRIWLVRSTIEDGRRETRKRLDHERLGEMCDCVRSPNSLLKSSASVTSSST